MRELLLKVAILDGYCTAESSETIQNTAVKMVVWDMEEDIKKKIEEISDSKNAKA